MILNMSFLLMSKRMSLFSATRSSDISFRFLFGYEATGIYIGYIFNYTSTLAGKKNLKFIFDCNSHRLISNFSRVVGQIFRFFKNRKICPEATFGKK